MVLMKRKIVTRVVAALLVFSALCSLTGCRGLMFTVDGGGFGPYIPQAKYEEGDFSGRDSNTIIGVRSDKNEFKIDEVYLDMYVAFFNKDDGAPTDFLYPNTDERKCAILYLSNGSLDDFSYVKNATIKELYNLKNRIFIKEFTQEEILSYGFSEKPFVGIVYDYKETVHIPKELFIEKAGIPDRLLIELHSYYSTDGEHWDQDGVQPSITLYYTIIDEETVRIRF